jgi:hypothetical protein
MNIRGIFLNNFDIILRFYFKYYIFVNITNNYYRPRKAFSNPMVLNFPFVSTVVGHYPYRVGPLVNWLNHRPKMKQPQRRLCIALRGPYSEEFLTRLLALLKEVKNKIE